MIPVALHVEDGHPRSLGDIPDVRVPEPPVDLADGDAVVVPTEDHTDLLGGVAVGDLGRLRLDELGVPTELGHAGFEAGTRPGGREEEQHGQHPVPQDGVWDAQRSIQLQSFGDLEHGLELFLRPLLGRDHVAAPKTGVHSTAPSTRASRAIRITTP